MPKPAIPAEVADDVQQLDAALREGKLSATAAENATNWLTLPQYARYRPQIQKLIRSADFAQLSNLFWEIIPFGTGGRRGLMADFGSATINERTIAESAYGLAQFLKARAGDRTPSAAIACDTRNRSIEFSRLTAATLAAQGVKVYFFESHRSTPELSFAVRFLKCDGGAMITASHNPPSDNGFKAYAATGGQVLDADAKLIIEGVYSATEIPQADFDAAVADGRIVIVGDKVDAAYIAAVTAMSLSTARDIPALFTPLHGVGEGSAFRTLQAAGFRAVEIFEPQRRPDGNFTNVPDRVSNPERPEVFRPAIDSVGKRDIPLILAVDPDADRLGVCVRAASGEFVHLTGNRIGVLLADYILRKRKQNGTLSPEHFVVETLVTTPLIGRIAKSHGVKLVDDLLVGFKYIGEAMDRNGPDKFVFGAEESLGYLAGQYARDKDASIAALYLMELAAELRVESKTLLDRLDAVYREHGYFVEGQISETCQGERGKEQIVALMRAFRERPMTELAGFPLERVRDYKQHEIRSLPSNTKNADLPQPSGELLFFDSAPGDFRFSMAARPSGTEPKIKFYFFAEAPVSSPEALEAVKQQTNDRLKAVQQAISAWVRQQTGS